MALSSDRIGFAREGEVRNGGEVEWRRVDGEGEWERENGEGLGIESGKSGRVGTLHWGVGSGVV